MHPVCETTICYPVLILKFMKVLYLSEKNFISVSPGVIFLTGHMTGQPFNSVNLVVKSWSSQCFEYLTLVPAVARLFCLALSGSFLNMFAQNKEDLCIVISKPVKIGLGR